MLIEVLAPLYLHQMSAPRDSMQDGLRDTPTERRKLPNRDLLVAVPPQNGHASTREAAIQGAQVGGEVARCAYEGVIEPRPGELGLKPREECPKVLGDVEALGQIFDEQALSPPALQQTAHCGGPDGGEGQRLAQAQPPRGLQDDSGHRFRMLAGIGSTEARTPGVSQQRERTGPKSSINEFVELAEIPGQVVAAFKSGRESSAVQVVAQHPIAGRSQTWDQGVPNITRGTHPAQQDDAGAVGRPAGLEVCEPLLQRAELSGLRLSAGQFEGQCHR